MASKYSLASGVFCFVTMYPHIPEAKRAIRIGIWAGRIMALVNQLLLICRWLDFSVQLTIVKKLFTRSTLVFIWPQRLKVKMRLSLEVKIRSSLTSVHLDHITVRDFCCFSGMGYWRMRKVISGSTCCQAQVPVQVRSSPVQVQFRSRSGPVRSWPGPGPGQNTRTWGDTKIL